MSAKYDAPPVRTPFFGENQDGTPHWSWKKWFQGISPRLTSPAIDSPPKTVTAAGIAGQVAFDANFVYVCVGSNSWKRSPLSTF